MTANNDAGILPANNGEFVEARVLDNLTDWLPEGVAMGAGGITVTVLPNYLKALLDCANKRKALRINADLHRRKLDIMGDYVNQSADLAGKRVAAWREVEVRRIDADSRVQLEKISAYWDARLAEIYSSEETQRLQIQAQLELQTRKMSERYGLLNREVDCRFDVFDALLEESKRQYNDSLRIVRARERERSRLVGELESVCAFLQKRASRGDQDAMSQYIVLIRLRIDLLNEGRNDEMFGKGLDRLIDGGML